MKVFDFGHVFYGHIRDVIVDNSSVFWVQGSYSKDTDARVDFCGLLSSCVQNLHVFIYLLSISTTHTSRSTVRCGGHQWSWMWHQATRRLFVAAFWNYWEDPVSESNAVVGRWGFHWGTYCQEYFTHWFTAAFPLSLTLNYFTHWFTAAFPLPLTVLFHKACMIHFHQL